jgi:hypothetical protein
MGLIGHQHDLMQVDRSHFHSSEVEICFDFVMMSTEDTFSRIGKANSMIPTTSLYSGLLAPLFQAPQYLEKHSITLSWDAT